MLSKFPVLWVCSAGRSEWSWGNVIGREIMAMIILSGVVVILNSIRMLRYSGGCDGVWIIESVAQGDKGDWKDN